MTNELAVQSNHAGTVAVAQPNPALDALMQHARTMDIAFKLADSMCSTALVPSRYRGKAQDGTAAILYGAELGLSPIQSLQRVVNINGMPGIEARTMVGLLKAKGYRFKTIEESDERVTVQGTAPDGDTETATWTIERAIKARYVPIIDAETGKFATNKNGNLIGNELYLTIPQEMLYAKAATQVCRRIAPEILLGISTTEDLRDTPEPDPEPVRVVTERVVTTGVAGIKADLGIGTPAQEASTVIDEMPVESPQVDASESGAKVDIAPQSEDGRATTAHLRKLFALLGEADIKAKPDRLLLATYILGGEPVESFGNLTTEAVDAIIDVLKSVGPQGSRDLLAQFQAAAAETEAPE